MVGPALLKTKKSLVTRYTNNLRKVIETIETSRTARDSCDELSSSISIDSSVFDLNASSKLVADALDAFTSALDTIENLPEEQETQTQQYIDASVELIDQAQRLAIELEREKLGQQRETIAMWSPEMAKPNLPAIPIPVFSGKNWEFSNFWTLFSANVHERPLSKLMKFNYLIDALRGEARELIRRFPVTESNYDHAVQLLRDKYSDESTIITNLQSRLENAKAEKPTIPSQRKLLEFILPIVTQLEDLGVSLDGSYLTRKLLAKFSPDVQRKVLEFQLPQNKKEGDWVIRKILSDLENVIITEEQIHEFVDDSKRERSQASQNNEITRMPFRRNASTNQGFNSCMFCDSTQHKSADCMKITSINSRRTAMQQQKRCLNCGRMGHFVKDCTSQGCRNCNGVKHHHTLCPQRQTTIKGATTQSHGRNPIYNSPQRITSTPNARRLPVRQRTTSSANAHTVQTEANVPQKQENTDTTHTTSKETAILQSMVMEPENGKVMLLTGIARVRDEVRGKWKEVEILFDTGADQSFISLELAHELGLECTQHQRLLLYTFGMDKPTPTKSGVTKLDIWNYQGQRHAVRLCTTPVLTGKGQVTQLSQEDLAFVSQHNIRLSKPTNNLTSRPQILLGCDQLWNFLGAPLPHYSLPSGLKLIPSKIGYLLTGKQQTLYGEPEQENEVNISVISMVNAISNEDDEVTRWDKYWTMDSAGVCEFTGTKQAEKDAINAQVETFFENTIERRDDGYYVRLPYKDNHPPLPDNRQIALKRLQGVINMLKANPKLLEDYANTFCTQLEKGIIEEIPNNQLTEGPITHYIPHQPVVTPHKETTKLRIVFDASSHYKNCPSLNDILHQGPIILPDIYAMLIRFRMLRYTATSDVEKAFLQVRLHELDRDATRFLWVRDVELPIGDDNIKTYRFTRVTFGLNVSPFLLAGTILHHLRYDVKDKVLAEEISENLYVDNLILSADTPEDLIKNSIAARQIFSDIGMNLREFLTNQVNLQEAIPKEACTNKTTQKVLGIEWNAEDDSLQIQCTFPPTHKVTKRTIAHQIASIYDPLGWLVPLLTNAKHFQQTLWKHNLDWDSILPENFKTQWEDISHHATGFQKSFSRKMLSRSGNFNIAVFADASDIAMASCAYAFDGDQSTLIMAKCKLPSIKTTMTMPKMEMNALTMATRLSWSIYEAMKRHLSRTLETPMTIFIFSDSQIALSWLSSSSKSSPGVLVSNRLKEIRRITDAFRQENVSVRFAYVNTKDNPADAGTRGLTRDQLQGHIWWSGPIFLRTPPSEWTNTFYAHEPEQLQEMTERITLNAITTNVLDPDTTLVDLQRFSSFTTAKRVTARALIFLKKLLRSLSKEARERIYENVPELRTMTENLPILQAQDITNARSTLIRHHQSTYLSTTYRKSMEPSLRPYRDTYGIWRSKGRLGNSTLEADAKSPIIIAPNTELTRLIIQETHGSYHEGIEHTISAVRQQYWVPKIRQQVRKLVHKCVKCRRFNGLPYPYPDSTDLPTRRVYRSRPFQHIGIDFFDLPLTSDENENTRSYGCIFTCTVTRLLHLEMIDSMSTIDFLNALRRFVARRGVPESITCDNAPTFLLSSTILSKGEHIAEINTDLRDALANQEIQWKHITPYAPWQGGFYERLIKSVKHALYKALRGATHRSGDHLRTILAEVEACLNSRPLTYQGAIHEEFVSIRPADFLQKDFSITLPLNAVRKTADNDNEYLPPDEIRALQTRLEVIDALQSSIEATEKFWKIWKDQYLIGLRETHRKSLTNRRHGQEIPKVGDIVLLCDPVLPRNNWRMARITEAKRGTDGAVREVELVTSTRRHIRRPVNLVTPLEITSPEAKESPAEEKEVSEQPQQQDNDTTPRYNLRTRRPIKYGKQIISSVSAWKPKPHSSKWFLFYLMLITFMLPNYAEARNNVKIACTSEGVLIHTTKNQTIELCADTFCKVHTTYSTPLLVKFPPEVTLHDHLVTLKWHTGEHLTILETMCGKLNFCEQLDCSICTTVLFNPECWPIGAIAIIAMLLYSLIAICYVLLYVPMTVGKPIRIMLYFTHLIIAIIIRTLKASAGKLMRCLRGDTSTSKRERLLAALAILMTLVASLTYACQEVNVFEHHSTVCSTDGIHEKCKIALTELLKINTFHREACLRLTHNTTLIANVKLRWKGLYLHCEQETKYFTRSTVLKQIDSKRCPTMGSCQDLKCAGINSSSLIPELDAGNRFPGRTSCMESCGGPGCDCFFLSSGCLFYRIYATPRNDKVYEIFRCTRWTEEIKLEAIVEDFGSVNGKRHYVLALVPNVPKAVESMTITMTDISLPPTPSLSNEFITDGTDVAIWNNQFIPDLLCPTPSHAQSMNCTLKDDCICNGAENSVRCDCTTKDIESQFHQLNHKLPIKTASLKMFKRYDRTITAKISQMVSADFVIEFNQTIDSSTKVVTNDICSIRNNAIEGCYHCSKGAQAKISCTGSSQTLGEILCDQHAFVIPCAPTPVESILTFHLDEARQLLNCTVKCGETVNHFSLSGILKYTNGYHGTLRVFLEGNSTEYHDIKLPDFSHIADVVLGWYKTLVCALLAVAVALVLSYLFLQTIGQRLIRCFLRTTFMLMCCPVRIAIFTIRKIRKPPTQRTFHQKVL